jgi:uncharacterized membrane protein
MQTQQQPSSKGSTWGLAIICGILGASVQSNAGGFIFGAMLGALLAQVFYLRGRTQALHQQLQELLRRSTQEQPARQATTSETLHPGAAAQPATLEAPKVGEPTSPRAIEPTPQLARPAAAAAETASTPSQPAWPPRPAPAIPRTPSAIDRLAGEFFAWLKRGNPLARIGIVILFFGAAFLAKYAADNSLFPIELRFIALALGAFGLLIIGWRLRDKRAVYAQLLQGGGIAGLYLTVFAATKLYQLLPLGFAFALMVVVALAAAVIAVTQNSLSLAVIGTAGGFLAPILVSSGSGNHVALFSYYAILNLGVFAIAWFKTWRVLNVLGFVLTFSITGLWRATGYESHELLSADFFLILFFLMYVAVSILNSTRQAPDLKGYVSGSLVFGLPVVAFSLHATLVSRIEYALAWSALALGAFYLLLGWTLYASRRASFRLLTEAFAALGVIFASLAIPLAFDTRTTAAMWAVEGAGLLWLGVRQQRKLARVFGALLQLGAGGGYLLGLHALQAQQPLLNSAYLGALMLGVSGVFSGYWLHRNHDRQAAYETGAPQLFTLWGVAWWLFGGLNEIDRFLPQAALGASLIYVALSAALLMWLGIKRAWTLPQTIALFLPTVAAIVALSPAMTLAHPFAQWGAAGWLSLFVAHFIMLRIDESRERKAVEWLHAGSYWMLALLIGWESSWQIEQRTSGVWASLPWGLAPALFVAWAGRRQLAPRWPLERYSTAYRMYGAAPLAIAVCAWIALVNLTNVGDPAWLPYLPLLNPLDVSVALCLASLALWWSVLRPEQRVLLWKLDDRALLAATAALVFLWLNAALIRTLHHNWGAPITAYGMAHSTLVQSSLSIFWGVLGFIAMTLAARQRWRYVWIVGAALMIVVVAKLFLIDLSNIGTIARIASFLTVGALLLITGYLAPLPPRRQSEQASA